MQPKPGWKLEIVTVPEAAAASGHDRGAGKPRDHSNEKQGGKIDLSALSAEERREMANLLIKAMGLGRDTGDR